MRTTFLTLVAWIVCSCTASQAWADSIAATALTCTGNQASDLNSFGTPVSIPVSAGASYAGVSSHVSDPSFVPPLDPPFVSAATVLEGTNGGGTTTVDMSWRTRAPGEQDAAPLYPLLPSNANYLASDIVKLEHVDGIYALQMSYSVGESDNRADGSVFLGWLDFNDPSFPSTQENDPNYDPSYQYMPVWKNAANKLRNSTTDDKFHTGSFATFREDPNHSGPLDAELWSWGIDTKNMKAWAVVDYNGVFAVVPEPGMVSMLLAGGVAMLFPVTAKRLRKRMAK